MMYKNIPVEKLQYFAKFLKRGIVRRDSFKVMLICQEAKWPKTDLRMAGQLYV